jgi:hypothetical protein
MIPVGSLGFHRGSHREKGCELQRFREDFAEAAVQIQANQKVVPGRSVAISYHIIPMAD